MLHFRKKKRWAAAAWQRPANITISFELPSLPGSISSNSQPRYYDSDGVTLAAELSEPNQPLLESCLDSASSDDDVLIASWLLNSIEITTKTSSLRRNWIDVPTTLTSLDSSSTFSTVVPVFDPMPIGDTSEQRGKPNGYALRQMNGFAPLDLRKKFIKKDVLKTIAVNTNNYVKAKGAGDGREWKDTTSAEPQLFFGIIIYMGVYRSP